jgi:hypothetical protein
MVTFVNAALPAVIVELGAFARLKVRFWKATPVCPFELNRFAESAFGLNTEQAPCPTTRTLSAVTEMDVNRYVPHGTNTCVGFASAVFNTAVLSVAPSPTRGILGRVTYG